MHSACLVCLAQSWLVSLGLSVLSLIALSVTQTTSWSPVGKACPPPRFLVHSTQRNSCPCIRSQLASCHAVTAPTVNNLHLHSGHPRSIGKLSRPSRPRPHRLRPLRLLRLRWCTSTLQPRAHRPHKHPANSQTASHHSPPRSHIHSPPTRPHKHPQPKPRRTFHEFMTTRTLHTPSYRLGSPHRTPLHLLLSRAPAPMGVLGGDGRQAVPPHIPPLIPLGYPLPRR